MEHEKRLSSRTRAPLDISGSWGIREGVAAGASGDRATGEPKQPTTMSIFLTIRSLEVTATKRRAVATRINLVVLQWSITIDYGEREQLRKHPAHFWMGPTWNFSPW